MQVSKLTLTTLPPPSKGDYQVLKLSGELDKSGLETVREKIETLVENFSHQNLVFDLSDMDFINSEGIGFFATIHSHLAKTNKSLVLIQARSNVKDIFSVIGLFTIIKYYETLEDFVRTVANE